ncbi:acyl-CoA dehydrogenase/oxidase [Catenaria anguillulae PL171]|uniref:Acyl-coenzyme A oxidase n=1 Tax=Catenaria anguillulae PL171 TaxID=765915 RepID=A0A1Y2H5M9_9FUNG|nr:acyl-CoA dehydrogenase/oxidase [Catenaria anguillulae PL171]
MSSSSSSVLVNKEMQSLAAERANPRFNVRDLTYLLDGGKEATELKEKFMLELERDPLWRMDDHANLSLAEVRERTMAKARLIVHFLANEPVHVFRQRMAVISVVDPAFWTRLGVHYGLFFGALQSQASSAQLQYWVSKGALAVNGMYGCFCMTELKHGSDVSRLCTTATFDPASDEFIVHTPEVGATKWWIGGAAQSATHAAVYAQLIVNGKRHGVKVFIVPLRDPKTFELLPGVAIGDIGKKMGRDGIDNGWVQFTNVRIPRSFMLQKHTKVKRDGSGRVAMVVDSSATAKKALTIAVRYGAIRRQFQSKASVLPLLAQTMAMHFTGVQTDKMYVSLMEQLDRAQPGDNMDKAHCTWLTLNIIEQCRQTLGGHGYSSYTELSGMAANWAVQCTWEGDNTILTLQSGRFLVSSYRDAQKPNGKSTLAKGVAYLAQLPEILNRKCSVDLAADNSLTAQVLCEAFDVACATAVHKAGTEFETALKANQGDMERAYEDCAQARFAAAKIHAAGYLFARFAEALADVPQDLHAPLYRLLILYGAHTVSEQAGAFLQSGYFTPKQLGQVQAHLNKVLKEVRTDAVPLVDAFNYTDYVINSPFGRFDGDIYTHYFERVKRLNPTPKVHPYFESTIKPLLNRSMEDIEGPELDD